MNVTVEQEVLKEVEEDCRRAKELADKQAKSLHDLADKYDKWHPPTDSESIFEPETHEMLLEVGRALRTAAETELKYAILKNMTRPCLQHAKATVTALISACQ